MAAARLQLRTAPVRRQQGAALLTALVVAAIAVGAAVALLAQLQRQVRQTANLVASEQALQRAYYAEFWARRVLEAEDPERTARTRQRPWQQPLLLNALDGASVSARIEALDGRINLNDLLDPGSEAEQGKHTRTRFLRLLRVLRLEPQIADAIMDWVDADREVRVPGGAEDDHYLLSREPHRTPNRPLLRVEELRGIRGITEDVYRKLEPFVTALPAGVPINVDSAPTQVLIALTDDMSELLARDIERGRPYARVDQLQLLSSVRDRRAAQEVLEETAVSGQYFLLTADVVYGAVRMRVLSLIQRAPGRSLVLRRWRGVPGHA